ncbi:hypothetical protein LZF95_19595 [Algoriphagus sp. AGSA1]|uniref:hypothetical protein n=1 Tax=Algoriphagus sp. AGSA1 TaxID=2907213 RepID=UPI001F34E30A|nr:hypothetical protein [Algoriphagus sp. AGSA1]MCE7056893.1 hypothetical protein [Algoriphagus sp. AGSA1]
MALLATFYQLHLQRAHNEKSLKPLVQVDLIDKDRLAIHIQNNGVGPMIVETIHYLKGDGNYSNLRDCLSLNARSFQHLTFSPPEQKIILAGSYLEVFSKRIKEDDNREEINGIRKQLAEISLQVHGRDIYNNKVAVERKLDWFERHMLHPQS